MSSSKFCVQISPEIRMLIKYAAVTNCGTMGEIVEILARKHLSSLTHQDIKELRDSTNKP